MTQPQPSPVVDPPCWLCGRDDLPVFVLDANGRAIISACAPCLAAALEVLTGYGFKNQLQQWEALSQHYAAQRSLRRVKDPQKGEHYAKPAEDETP